MQEGEVADDDAGSFARCSIAMPMAVEIVPSMPASPRLASTVQRVGARRDSRRE